MQSTRVGDMNVLPAPQQASTSASYNFAEGGVLPDSDPMEQDSGNAAPPDTSPFAMIAAALSYGRRKSGLPEKFYQEAGADTRPIPPKPNTTAPKPFNPRDYLPGGPQATKVADEDDASRPQMRTPAGEQGNNVADPETEGAEPQPEEDTAMYAEGGAVEDEGVLPTSTDDTESDGDVMPQDTQAPGAPPSPGAGKPGPDKALGYLSGADAMPPEMAAALEAQVDPRGQMDPSQRKLLAVQAAGDPAKAWGLMQHYRQKFSAYSAFARAAAEGTPQKPADLMASAKAATQAYENLPDGKALNFMPVQGGMRVAVRDLNKQQQQQQQPEPQQFEEGGAVEDDELQRQRAGVLPEEPEVQEPSGAQRSAEYLRKHGAAASMAAIPGAVQEHVSQRGAAQSVADFVLSVPEFIGWLTKGGQADAVLDKGVEKTLTEAKVAAPAAQAPPQMGDQGGQPEQAPAGMEPGAKGTFAPPAMPRNQAPTTRSPTTPQASFNAPRQAPQGEKVFERSAPKGLDQELVATINAQFPYVGQERERQAAFQQALMVQSEQENKLGVAKEQGVVKRDVANIAGANRMNVANTNIAGKLSLADLVEKARTDRATTGQISKETIAAMKEAGADQRFIASEIGKNTRTAVTNAPGLQNKPDKLTATVKSMGDQVPRASQEAPAPKAPQPKQPQQPQAQTPQMKLVNGVWYKRGPNGEAVPVQ